MDAILRTDAEALGLSSQRLARIDGWMDRLVEEGKLAGLSVLVARRGGVAYRRCCGNWSPSWDAGCMSRN